MNTVEREGELREQLVTVMAQMSARGLNRGTSGNASARCGAGMLITPSGVMPTNLTPAGMVYVEGDGARPQSQLRPSSEWRMHAELYARRPDTHAIVHCHSRFATTLACAHKPIPALHYMVGVSGKATVPLARYHPFGSAELAHAVADTVAGGTACLMANHGLIALARDLERGLAIAEEIEEQAAVYWGTLAIGGPVLLSSAEMDEVFRRFASYGQKP